MLDAAACYLPSNVGSAPRIECEPCLRRPWQLAMAPAITETMLGTTSAVGYGSSSSSHAWPTALSEGEHCQPTDDLVEIAGRKPSERLPSRAWSCPLSIGPPRLKRLTNDVLALTCSITDLEYRLVEYVLEVQHCNGAIRSPAPWRVYYARVGEQRKRDDVTFPVPRRKPCGQVLWEPGGVYQFRLTGRCAYPAQDGGFYSLRSDGQLPPRQVVSEWSANIPLPATARSCGTPSRTSESSRLSWVHCDARSPKEPRLQMFRGRGTMSARQRAASCGTLCVCST